MKEVYAYCFLFWLIMLAILGYVVKLNNHYEGYSVILPALGWIVCLLMCIASAICWILK